MKPEKLKLLKTELETDPAGVGYDIENDSHVKLARKINNAGRELPRDESLETWQLFECFDYDEYSLAVKTNKAAMLGQLLSMGTFSPAARNVRLALKELFGEGSKTMRRLNRLDKRSGTRAEELGFGRVTESDVANALLRTE